MSDMDYTVGYGGPYDDDDNPEDGANYPRVPSIFYQLKEIARKKCSDSTGPTKYPVLFNPIYGEIPMKIVAMDVDLRAIYAVDNRGDIIANNEAYPEMLIPRLVAGKYDLILIEVASPVIYRAGEGAASNLIKWVIYNTYVATTLGRLFDNVLVAPSNQWAKVPLGARHKVAKCKMPNKDLREAECMLYFHSIQPAVWKPFDQYMQEIGG